MLPEAPYRVYLGYDVAETVACNVASESMLDHTNPKEIQAYRLGRLSLMGIYNRPTMRMPNGQLYDEISDAPMSTDHAIARFWVPYLCRYKGWALFTDGDVLFREDVRQLFALADPKYAVQVVKHKPMLENGEKKGGHIQQPYPRKNWSSVMLFNCGHPAHRALTVDVLNAWPGRDLHAFKWLTLGQIGSLPAQWNYLVGVTPLMSDPAIVHYTLGTPLVAGHEGDPFSDEWWTYANGHVENVGAVRA